MSKEFDKIINKKIGGTEVKPSAGLWDRIVADLPEEKENKVFFLLPLLGTTLFKNAMAASVIFLLGGFSAFYFLNQDNNNSLAEDSTTNQNNIENNISKTVTAQTEEMNCNENKTEQNHLANNTNQANYNNKTITNPSNNRNGLNTNLNNYNKNNYSNSIYASKATNNLRSKSVAKAYFDPKVSNTENSNTNLNMSVNDYVWVYDENTGSYTVFLKEENNNLKDPLNISSPSYNKMFAETEIENDIDEPTFMSIIPEKKKEDKPEILKENEEDSNIQHFKSKSNKINYKGFWLGPNVGYEAIFVGNSVYHGGSFGVDVGYDFGGSWGIQSGLKYAINSKFINITDADGIETSYRSEFNSVHLPLFARYKFTKLTKARPLSLNFIGGLDYAFVNTKNLHQIGLNLGAEYDVFTQADLMVTLGVRGGMYNNLKVYKLDFPEQINRYNYSLSAYLSVRFIDWAKKK